MEPHRWRCESCGHRWPEEWPKLREGVPEQSEAERRVERIRESREKYARLTGLADEPPKNPTALVDRVLRRTSRPDDRSYGVRFPWGRVIIEKTTELVNEGGAPEFDIRVRCWGDPPSGWEDEAVAVALRHVKRYGDEPYAASRPVSAPR